MSTQQALALPSPAASNTVVINARCSLRIEADQRVIVVGGLPVHHYRAEDAVAEAYAMVFLVESGFAQQTDVARAFDRSVLGEKTAAHEIERETVEAIDCPWFGAHRPSSLEVRRRFREISTGIRTRLPPFMTICRPPESIRATGARDLMRVRADGSA